MTLAESERMLRDIAFHDQFLSFGSPPIPLVRKAMQGSDGGPLF